MLQHIVTEDPSGRKRHYRKVALKRKDRYICDTCKHFYSNIVYGRGSPPDPDFTDAGCSLDDAVSYRNYASYRKVKESIAKRTGLPPKEVVLIPEDEWVRLKDYFGEMAETVMNEEAPCFFWKQRLVEICPTHGEVVDPDEGCNTCYIYMRAEIEESAIEAGMSPPPTDLNYRALKKQLEEQKDPKKVNGTKGGS